MEDLKALRVASFQSTGDLINELIEAELSGRAEEIAEGKAILEAERARELRAKQRSHDLKVARGLIPEEAPGEEQTEDAPESEAEGKAHGPGELPTDEDIEAWASLANPRERSRYTSNGRELIKYLRVEGLPLTMEVLEERWWPILEARHPNVRTARNNMGKARGLCRWWNEQRESDTVPSENRERTERDRQGWRHSLREGAPPQEDPQGGGGGHPVHAYGPRGAPGP